MGATAASKAIPDFEKLEIELKSVPVDLKGRPMESTFVTCTPLAEVEKLSWRESTVHHKLSRVLFIPVEADHSLPLKVRRVGNPLFWSPTEEQEAQLKADWELFAELIASGFVESITAHRGDVLQIRPKAAHSQKRTLGTAADGDLQATLPRGFYLRSRFTRALFEATYHLPAQ